MLKGVPILVIALLFSTAFAADKKVPPKARVGGNREAALPTFKPAKIKESAPDYVREYIKRSDVWRVEEIAKHKTDLEAAYDAIPRLKKANVDRRAPEILIDVKRKRAVFQTIEQRKEAVENQVKIAETLEKLIEQLSTIPVVDMPLGPTLSVGDIGALPERGRVFQVVGKTAMIVVFQIGDKEQRVWINGTSAGIADDDVVAFKGLYRVTGTKTYQALIGSNTLMTAERIDVDKFVE